MDAQFLLREYVGESLVVVPSEQLLQVRNSMIRYLSLAAILVLTVLNPIQGGEPVTLETVVDPGPNDLSEPIAQDYSLEKAVHFLLIGTRHHNRSKASKRVLFSRTTSPTVMRL